MLRIGCHISSSGGFLKMAREAVRLGANTFQYFSRNPRGGSIKAFDEGDAQAFLNFCAENGIDKPLTHAPYTLNPCSANDETLDFAHRVLKEDIGRLEYFENAMYNLHPGSHTGQGVETGIRKIAKALNGAMFAGMRTTVLLETMAGKGSEVGGRFEELRDIISLIDESDRIGVCLDTCHVFDGGYDIVNDLDGVLNEFDRIIGIGRLRAIHLNDSKNPLASHKDRHEKLGLGMIGEEALLRIVNHSALAGLPFYLETPNEAEGYAREIAFVRTHTA